MTFVTAGRRLRITAGIFPIVLATRPRHLPTHTGARPHRIALLAQMPRAKPAPLRFLDAVAVGAQATPLLAVVLLTYAIRIGNNVALFVFVRRGGLTARRRRLRTLCNATA